MLDIFSHSQHLNNGKIRANSLSGMMPPKLTLQRSITDGIKNMFAFHRHAETSLSPSNHGSTAENLADLELQVARVELV